MQVTTKIKVDMTQPNFEGQVNAVQGDGNTRYVEATLLENGRPWQLPETADVAVAYTKPDHTKGLYNKLADGTPAVTVNGSVVSVILAPQMLTVPGTVQAGIVINNAKLDQLTTFPFSVRVAGSPFAGAQKSEDYIRLQWLEDKLDAYVEKLSGAAAIEATVRRIVEAYMGADLRNAVITATGDSITAQERNYAKLIAEKYDMTYENAAIGGATVAAEIYNVDGGKRPCICDTIASMRQDADIILLSGGVNDQVELNHGLESLGELTDGFDKKLNKATLYGALEYMLRQAVFKWSNKTILYVLPHRMTQNLDYRNAVLAACKKYGVPVVDLMDSTMDFYTLSEFKGRYTANGDGWHPNETGYETFYVPEILSALRKHFRGKGETVTLEDSSMPEVICVNTSVSSEEIYTPDIPGFIRTNGTISTSVNYLRTDYLPLPENGSVTYNVFVSGSTGDATGQSTWAIFDGEKQWLASSDDREGTDFWHVSANGKNLMFGWKNQTLSIADLLESYPTAVYIVLSTYVNPEYETIHDINGTNFGWGTDEAYIMIATDGQ